jgi:hypothetical protein
MAAEVGWNVATTAWVRMRMVAEFIETSAEARRGLKALEAPHRSMTALDPTMVLLDPIIQILVGPVFYTAVQLSPDRG